MREGEKEREEKGERDGERHRVKVGGGVVEERDR